MRQLARGPLPATGIAIALVGLGVLGLRGLGAFEGLELGAYDWFMRLRPFHSMADPRILLVTVTERDIQNVGSWPLPDGVLAQAVEILARHGPRAIGLDIYRDIPVPPGSESLAALLTRDRRVIGVMKFGEGPSGGLPPPAPLRGTDRIGFNDILVDPGGIVRRGLLFLDDGVTTADAFALRLALVYLQAEGVTPQPDPADPRQLRLGRTTIRALEPNDGAYVRADARGYQFLLDFTAGRRPFRSVTLTTVLSEAIEPSAVRDKIILIGVTAESVKDHFYTPYSRALQTDQQFPGMAIHAHIVSQLLRIGLEGAAPMATPPPWQTVAWILLWSATGGAIGRRVRSPVRFLLAAGCGILTLGFLDFVAFNARWWLPLVPPAVACLISVAVVTAYMSYQESAQRAALMQLFSRSVSKEVAETIWQQRDQFVDGGRPRARGLVATALFTDLTGFTTVSETLPPEALMDWLNEYMEAMTRQVSLHGGVIRQYAGDSIVVIFGVPVPRRTDAEIARDAVNAVQCALAMETTLVELNSRWRAEGRPMTGMRVGIFTGPVVAGTLGGAERSEYAVVGDTVNIASRLESFDKDLFAPDPATRPCRILIGETTLENLGHQFETERVGDVSLKGKARPVGVYRVVARAPAKSEALGEGERR